MSSANRRSWTRALWVLPAVLAASALGVWRGWSSLPRLPQAGAPPVAFPSWPEITRVSTTDWHIVQHRGGALLREEGAISKRYRLAGTFFEYGSDSSNEIRRAILDDAELKTQHIVAENDTVADVRVVSIMAERVVLADGSGETELWISFARGGTNEAAGRGQVAGSGESPANYPYGVRQIGENRWIFNRNRLMDYYRELMDEPERLVKIFDSLKPVYTQDGRNITGYVLGVEGERQFFDTVGLRQGDVVRSVNSLPMTNRRRAEFFIKQFVTDRANAFVLDVQRQGQQQKLVYEVR